MAFVYNQCCIGSGLITTPPLPKEKKPPILITPHHHTNCLTEWRVSRQRDVCVCVCVCVYVCVCDRFGTMIDSSFNGMLERCRLCGRRFGCFYRKFGLSHTWSVAIWESIIQNGSFIWIVVYLFIVIAVVVVVVVVVVVIVVVRIANR